MLKNIPSAKLCLMISIVSVLIAATAFSSQDKGRKTIKLFGGEKYGPVFLDHHAHQAIIPDCQTCHKSFAKEQGAIARAMQSGKLEPKRIMNGTCNKCHRVKKEDGQRTASIKCKDCHKK
jgi:hypothetical protein